MSCCRVLCCFLVFMAFANQPLLSQRLPDLSLQIDSGNRLFHYSNKRGSFFVGETHAWSSHGLMGFISHRESIFTDYNWLSPNDENPLFQRSESSVEVNPAFTKRNYSTGEETIFVPDQVDGVHIQTRMRDLDSLLFELFISKATAISRPEDHPETILVTLNNELNRFLAISTNTIIGEASLQDSRLTLALNLPTSEWEGRLRTYSLSIGAGRTREEAFKAAGLILGNHESLLFAKKARLERLLKSTRTRVQNPLMDKALAWARLSFDALNMNEIKTELGKGIYAGYPWFQDYWGRDSFIAMRALTTTGQFETVKATISSFLKFQNQDADSPDFGKIPNRARPGDVIYNTADATARLLIEIDRYVQYSRDSAFAKQVWSNVEKAIKGTWQHRSDSLGFLLHEDADTWMDAKGPKGAYSPRGNRANDIQALWIASQNAILHLAPFAGDSVEVGFTDSLKVSVEKGRTHFRSYFINPEAEGAVVFDALKPSGEPRTEIRPNQLFTHSLLDMETKTRVLAQVTNSLSTPFGLLSLNAEDSTFHPFHKFEPVYEQDAAYHNGVVWLWNSGSWLSMLYNAGFHSMANRVLTNYSDLILSGKSLGTLPELADAFPRNKESVQFPDETEMKNISRFDQLNLESRQPGLAFSGAFSQAWSLSEFIRVIREYGIGVRVRLEGQTVLAPSFSPLYSGAAATFDLGDWWVDVSFSDEIKPKEITWLFTAKEVIKIPREIFVKHPSQAKMTSILIDKSSSKLILRWDGSQPELSLNQKAVNVEWKPAFSEFLFTDFPPMNFTRFGFFDHSNKDYTSQTNNQ